MRPIFNPASHPPGILAALAIAAALGAMTGCDDDGIITGLAPAAESISVQIAPTKVALIQGHTTDVAINISRSGGYIGEVALTITDAPAGVTATVHPVSLTGSSSTLTLVAAETAVPGVYSFTVTGSGPGIASHSASLALTVVIAPTIAVQLDPDLLEVKQAQSGTVGVTVLRAGGYADDVSLRVAGMPDGVTADFTRPFSSEDSLVTTTLTAWVSGTAKPGTYPLTITASGVGVVSRSATLSLTVIAPTPPAIAVEMPAAKGDFIWVVRGYSDAWEVVVTRFGFTGVVELSIEGLPPRVTAGFDPASLEASMTTSQLTITAASDAPVGDYTVTVIAKAVGVPVARIDVRFIVFPPAGS